MYRFAAAGIAWPPFPMETLPTASIINFELEVASGLAPVDAPCNI